MEKFTEYSGKFDSFVEKNLGFLKNDYVSAIIIVILIAYAGLVAPKLPKMAMKILDNSIVKIIFFFMIVFLMKYSPSVSLIAAIAVIVSLQTINRYKAGKEMFQIIKAEQKAEKKIKYYSAKGCKCDTAEPEYEEDKPVTTPVTTTTPKTPITPVTPITPMTPTIPKTPITPTPTPSPATTKPIATAPTATPVITPTPIKLTEDKKKKLTEPTKEIKPIMTPTPQIIGKPIIPSVLPMDNVVVKPLVGKISGVLPAGSLIPPTPSQLFVPVPATGTSSTSATISPPKVQEVIMTIKDIEGKVGRSLSEKEIAGICTKAVKNEPKKEQQVKAKELFEEVVNNTSGEANWFM